MATLSIVLLMIGCSAGLESGLIGRPGVYNYSPTIIQSGELRQIWWCSQAVNPNKPSQDSDTIQYFSINLLTHETYGPKTVLAETPGAWDSVFTCNPKVVGGVFNNPLGDGQTYHYAMYYVATGHDDGSKNCIGVAFSNDGIAWKKYPQPVIMYNGPGSNYGVGQPSVYNRDGASGITMFYEDDWPVMHHVGATSSDGIHFAVQGTLTSAGMNPDNPNPLWGDMAYDPTTKSWYAVFNTPTRDQSTTGGVVERGQYGSVLYRIPADSVFTGDSTWQEVYTVDTNMTGYESNFLAGFVRDSNGNLNPGPSPQVEMYVSVSNPAPSWNATPAQAGNSGETWKWALTDIAWVPGQPLMTLYRYHRGATYIATTGRIDSSFQLEAVLGRLYQGPQQGATLPFYACKAGTTDYFISLDPACEGQRILGKHGYGYSKPVDGLNLQAIYLCSTAGGHFASKDPKCEGQKVDKLLGYVLP